MPRKVGRKMRWPERIGAKTLDRIEKVLGKDEPRLDFIREAVERELTRREKRQPRKGTAPK
jgi:hypothetical protein